MITGNKLELPLNDFQKAVKKLGDAVNKSSIDWKDAQFNSLSNSIKSVAASSKQVLAVGNQCCSAIKHFNAIESEKY